MMRSHAGSLPLTACYPIARTFCTWLGVLLLALLAVRAQAQSLAPLRSGALPSLHTGASVQYVAVLAGRPLAIADGEVWRLDRSGKTWVRQSLPADTPPIVGIVGNGTQVWLLTSAPGTHETTGVARLDASDDQLRLQPLPPFPAPLRDAHGAWANDILSIVGLGADGKPCVLQLQTNVPQPRWSVLAGWPGNGAPSSVVARAGALLVSVPDADRSTERLWRRAADGWSERGVMPGRLLPGSGHALGQANALYLVVDGTRADAPVRLMTFQTITSAWATLPGAAPANVIAAGAWTDGVFWAQRSTDAARVNFGYASVQTTKLLLRWLDWAVISIYLVAMIGIGLHFYLR